MNTVQKKYIDAYKTLAPVVLAIVGAKALMENTNPRHALSLIEGIQASLDCVKGGSENV